MRTEKKYELLEKGWKDSEIKKAEEILEKAEQNDVFFSRIVFWSVLVVIIFSNLMISLILIPFLIALDRWFLYAVVVILAGTIGFLYNFLITDISHLERRHHLLAGIIVPIMALANTIIMVLFANRFTEKINIHNQHNPWLLSVVFSAAFILPYIIDRIRMRLKE